MYKQFEPIIAISTPTGNGAVGVIRLSGRNIFKIVNLFLDKPLKKNREAGLRRFIYGDDVIDECIVIKFDAPRSFTGEDVVELYCHGNYLLLEKIVDVLVSNSEIRIADPGEFTKRAFLNNKIDLTQAEAIADIVSAKTEKTLQISMKHLNGDISYFLSDIRENLIRASSLLELEIDFSNESLELVNRSEFIDLINQTVKILNKTVDVYNSFRKIEQGISVSIIGKPNVGKSSLLNAILNKNRAIVSEKPGTTRDYISDSILYKDVLFNFFDTAGIRKSQNGIEKSGINFTRQIIEKSDVIIVVFDCSQAISNEDIEIINQLKRIKNRNIILAMNKSDVGRFLNKNDIKIMGNNINDNQIIFISATKKTNINDLKEAIYKLYKSDIINIETEITITNQRQFHHIMAIIKNLERATYGFENQLPTEIISADLRLSIDHLGEITGQISSDDILKNIFDNFCIGK